MTTGKTQGTGMKDQILSDQYRIGDDALTRQAMGAIGGVAWGSIFLLIGSVAAFVTVWVLAASGAIPLWAGCLLNSYLVYVMYTPMHEAVHGNVQGQARRYRWLNDIVGGFVSVPLLLPYHWHKYTHLAHHSSTNTADGDPDHWMAVRGFGPVVLRGLTILYAHASFFFIKQAGRIQRKHLYLGWAEFAAAYGMLLALGLSGLWLEVLLLSIVPFIFGFALIGIFFDWLVHVPYKETARFRDTNIFRFPEPVDTLISLLYLYQNYHLIHHLFPRVPFYRMRKVYRLMAADLQERGAPVFAFGVKPVSGARA